MAKKKKVLVLHGPNLNLLGRRQPKIYGRLTLQQINNRIKATARELGVQVECRQSNSEGKLVSWIQQSSGQFGALVINAAAYTHSSVALRDALVASGIPAVEVHISNIYKREEFRKKSLIADAVVGQIAGFGVHSYLLGLRAAVQSL
ncbi:MAG: type II 3-dehydroquinate dehydratase [Candidatus Binatia bacterium]|jgi:3-dehydroquinate dehydratase-2|nr:type II 3-dehydroquinate dehydratase [Candidatus Binatia bacterium]